MAKGFSRRGILTEEELVSIYVLSYSGSCILFGTVLLFLFAVLDIFPKEK